MSDMAPPTGSTWELRDPAADTLVVTNMWPDVDRPVYGIFVKRQVESLRENGLHCDVLYVRGYGGLRVYARALAWFALNGGALRARYTLIHAHAGETALVSSPAIRIPKIASYCGDDILGQANPDGSFSWRARVRRWAIQRSAYACTATITKSRAMQNALPRSLHSANNVVPNGVDERVFVPVPRAEARLELGWDREALIVLFAATRPRESRKRLPLAEQAVELASERLRSLELVVAENVPPETLPLMMSGADCLLLTSRIEGSPNVVKEAIMCNLPVVSTDVGDVRELLEGVEPSAVVEAVPESISEELVRVLQSRQRSNGRELRADLRADVVAHHILQLYASLRAPQTQLRY